MGCGGRSELGVAVVRVVERGEEVSDIEVGVEEVGCELRLELPPP